MGTRITLYKAPATAPFFRPLSLLLADGSEAGVREVPGSSYLGQI